MSTGVFTLSPYAASIPFVDISGQPHDLYWDFIHHDGLFAHGSGVALMVKHEDGSASVLGVSPFYPQGHPALNGGDRYGRLKYEARQMINRELQDLDDSAPGQGNPDTPHPVSETGYQALQGLAYDPTTRRMA